MVEQPSRTPTYIRYLLAIILIFLLFFLTVSLLLRYQVEKKTNALTEANNHLKEEINKRQRTMQELKKYARVVEASSDGIALFDQDNHHLLVNEAYLRIFRRKRDDLHEQTLIDITGEQFFDTYLRIPIQKCLQGRQTDVLAVYVTPEGETRYWHIHLGPYTVSGDYILGFAIDIRDISQQKELENRLKHAQKMEAIGLLAGGVAHDLNNILSGIVSYPDMLLIDRPESDPMFAPLQTMKKSGKRAAAIVSDLLTLARREVAHVTITNLNTVVSEFIASPEYSALYQPFQSVLVETLLDKELLNIKGSPVHLSKCLMNLFTNGLEAMAGTAGTLTIATENMYIENRNNPLPEMQPGEYTVLLVTDTGIGMSDETTQHIFEPFYTSKVMGRSGTGLGMTLVWNTVKDHSGHITVNSAPGAGSTFSLFFPATRETASATGPGENIASFRGIGERVLVVDDAEEQRQFASEILVKLGYRVDTARNGKEAVEKIRSSHYDILILDMIMPGGMDGLETFIHIRQLRPGQKALIASGYSETERIAKALDLGAGAYIRKPYTVLSLAKALKKELRPADGS